MIWNQNTWACECPSTAVWNGNYCINNPCDGGRVWDNFSRKCICVNNFQFLNGICSPPEIFCPPGTFFNFTTLLCECDPTKWRDPYSENITCQDKPVCLPTQIYNVHNNKCECAPGLVYLTAKQACGDPTCPINQRWNGIGCVNI